MAYLNTILYLGLNGFPNRDAGIQRQLHISKAIKSETTRALVVNRKGVHTKEKIVQEGILTSGIYEGIEYIYTSGGPEYKRNFIIRNFLKIVGTIIELYIIVYNKLFNRVKYAIVKTDSIFNLKYYYYLTRVLRIKLIFDYLEYRSSLKDRTINDYVDEKSFDFIFYKYVDCLIIISHYLANHIKKVAPGLPYIIIPPIIDFEKFEKNKFIPREINYFLFCGSTVYIDVIEFVIKCYNQSKSNDHGVSLIIVTIGDHEKINRLREYASQNPRIKILTYLSYKSLIGYYKHAKALLIPLTNNLQDKARFPFKISEYTAAGRPIISSDSGAVVNYFEDGVNALLAKTDSSSDFTSKLDFILANPQHSETIAKRGYETGKLHFNYKSYSQKLKHFLDASAKN